MESALGRFASFTLGQSHKHGFFDQIEVDPSGIIRVDAWSRKAQIDTGLIPIVRLDDHIVPFLQHYRTPRPDVNRALQLVPDFQLGFVSEYLVPESLLACQFELLSVALDGVLNFQFRGPFQFLNPHYRPLFDDHEVFHRSQIYGSGPPNSAPHPDIRALALKLRGPLLDFGCGSGALLSELQAAGVDAHGLELNSDIILRSVKPELMSSITLYDGRFPSPFRSSTFRTVFCSEVLEHISDYEAAIQEIARLSCERAVFTVPDASAIPLGFRHGLTPWHLLEGTHVNFFNQANLKAALGKHFSEIRFGRVCGCRFNDSPFFVSLVADCYK